MNLRKLDETVTMLKDGLKGSLLGVTIWHTGDGQPIAGHNVSPIAAALGNKMTQDVSAALKESLNVSIGKYYLIDLVNGNKMLIVPMGDYQMGIVVDKNAQLGMLLNIIVPKVLDKFEEALVED